MRLEARVFRGEYSIIRCTPGHTARMHQREDLEQRNQVLFIPEGTTRLSLGVIFFVWFL